MSIYLKVISFIIIYLYALPAWTLSKKVDWLELRPNLWIARNQTWGDIKFSALRFHLGYYKMSFVDIKTFRDSHIRQLRELSDNRKFSNALLEVGIGAIFQIWPDQSIVAVAPAGWSRSLRMVAHSGLLKISGKTFSDYDDRESLSAILCLQSPSFNFHDYDYQVPAFFRTSDPRQKMTGERCNDAVQVGPRIIEDPAKSDDQRGIQQAETSLPPQVRVVFALDNPGRAFPPSKPNPKLRENARNGYIIVTEIPVHLWDIQQMLLSPEFYGGGSPHWAINMAGGGPSGLIVKSESQESPIIIGNPTGVIGSALVITTRER